MKTFDGRRSRSTRAVRFSRSVRQRRSRRRARRLSVPNPHEGAHPAHRDGTSEGSASRSHVGKTTPACEPEERMPRRSETIVPARKLMGRRETRHASARVPFEGRAPRRAKACRARTKRRKTFSAAGRDSIDSSTKVDRCWVPVSTVSMADAGRTHLWSCGSDRESGSGGVETLKRGVEIRVGSSRRTRSSRESSFERVRRTPKEVGRDERVRRVPTFAGLLPQSGIHDGALSAVSCDTVEGVPVQKP